MPKSPDKLVYPLRNGIVVSPGAGSRLVGVDLYGGDPYKWGS